MKLKLLPPKADIFAAGGTGRRRVLALGPALMRLADGPLAGAAVDQAGLERCRGLTAEDCDLLIIDADAWEPMLLAAAIQSLPSDHTPPVLLVGQRLPTAVVRNLLRLERSDVLEAPYTHEQVDAAIFGLFAAPQAHTAPPVSSAGVSRCWALTGAVGGAGATTLAIEVATALAARSGKDRSVCFIDLNLADGAAAAYLGAQPAMRLGEQAADRLDASMLQAFITPISRQMDLLAGPRDPTAFDTVSRETVLRMLEVACDSYDWVILDMPRHRRSWSLEALAGCDEVLVVSELTVPALLAARALSDEIEESVEGALKPRIILNRLASRMFGPAPSMAEAERALQRKAEAGVSSDWEAAAASANLGGPIATHRPKSKIVKDIAAMVERLADAPSRKDAEGAAKAA